MRYSVLLLLLVFCYSCQVEKPNLQRQYIDAPWELYLEQFTNPIADSITIPSTVHSAIIAKTRHPFIGNNENRMQWITETDWTYKTQFKVDRNTLEKEYINLHFEGIDTYASISLNGVTILETDNAFLHLLEIECIPEKPNFNTVGTGDLSSTPWGLSNRCISKLMIILKLKMYTSSKTTYKIP